MFDQRHGIVELDTGGLDAICDQPPRRADDARTGVEQPHEFGKIVVGWNEIIVEEGDIVGATLNRRPQTYISLDGQSLCAEDHAHGKLIDPGQAWILDYYRIDPLDDVVVAKESDEPIRGRLAYGSPEWLTRFLLGFGGTVRVVDDRDIDDAVTNAARAARARYR